MAYSHGLNGGQAAWALGSAQQHNGGAGKERDCLDVKFVSMRCYRMATITQIDNLTSLRPHSAPIRTKF